MDRFYWPKSNNPLDSIIWTLVVGGILLVAIVIAVKIYAAA